MGSEQHTQQSLAVEQFHRKFPALDGIRGVAFFLVFLIHYVCSFGSGGTRRLLTPQFVLNQTGWFLVPLFFTLSGFLITRMLVRTRERAGYLRVFYAHRALRIFPLYFFTLGIVAAIVATGHMHFLPRHLLFAGYLQNFSPQAVSRLQLPYNLSVMHLWSMAVEEQFYLIWPIVIWFIRSERMLLRFCYLLIGVCTVVRFIWPLLHLSYEFSYFSTATRGDAIILGAVLAVFHGQPEQWDRLVKAARIATPAIWIAAIATAYVHGGGMPTDYFGVTVMIPTMNLIGAGFVVLAIQPEGIVHNFCKASLICRFGKLSYGLYLFHFIYLSQFKQTVVPTMALHTPLLLAKFAGILIYFGFTLGAAALAYRFLEMPLLSFKKHFRYGPAMPKKSPAAMPKRSFLVLPEPYGLVVHAGLEIPKFTD